MAARLAEDVMVLLVDPAALGGLAGLIAVASWAMGRAHGSLSGERRPDSDGVVVGPADPMSASAATDRPFTLTALPAHGRPAPAPCQQRALEERRAVLARPFALAELHAEASAIRRDERILGNVPAGDALIVLTCTPPGTGCRFIGLSGQPTCPGTTRLACPDNGACQAPGAQGHPRISDPV